MNSDTISALLEINRRFYERFAAGFSASRERPWPGWARVLDRVLESRKGTSRDAASRIAETAAGTLSVLDVGCGNGRFGSYLLERWPGRLRYLGLDGCGQLLSAAAQRLEGRCPDLRLVPFELGRQDLGETLGEERFDLVALFGILHHLPGRELRQALFRDLTRRISPAGVVAASVWQPDRRGRLARKVLPWQSYNHGRCVRAIDLGQLEAGDRLLSWSGDTETPRFCHFPGAREIAGWTATPDLSLIDRFEADGRGGRDNLYLVFRRKLPEEPPAWRP